MLKLNFNTPIPKSQRDNLIRSLKSLGFSYERVYQGGVYSLHKFYGRLPTITGSSDVDIIFTDKKSIDDFKQTKIDSVEMYFIIERENYED